MQGLLISVPGFVFLVCHLAFVTTTSSDGTQKVDMNTRSVSFSVRACQFAAVKFHTNHGEEFTLVLDVPQSHNIMTYLLDSYMKFESITGKILSCTDDSTFKATIKNDCFEIIKFSDNGQEKALMKIDTTLYTDLILTKLQMKTIWNTGNWTEDKFELCTQTEGGCYDTRLAYCVRGVLFKRGRSRVARCLYCAFGVNNKHIVTPKHDSSSSSQTWTNVPGSRFPSDLNFQKRIWIKACRHAQVGFKLDGKFYDIIIDENNNNLTQLYINGNVAVGPKTTHSGSVLSCGEFRRFELSIGTELVDLRDTSIVIRYRYTNVHKTIESFQYKTVGNRGDWKFGADESPGYSIGSLGLDDFPAYTNHDKTVTLNTHLSFSVKSCQHAVIKFSLTNHNAETESLILTIDKPILHNGLKYKSTLCNVNDCAIDNKGGVLNCSKSVNFEAELSKNTLKITATGMDLQHSTIRNGMFRNVKVSTVWSTGQWLIGEKHINTGNSAILTDVSGSNTKGESCRNLLKFGIIGYQHAQIDIIYNELYTVVIGGLSDTTAQIFKDSVLMVENVTNSVLLSSTEYLNFTLKIENGKISLFSGTGYNSSLIIMYSNQYITDDFQAYCTITFYSYWVTWKLYEIDQPACGTNQTAPTGTIQSPGFPEYYPADIECIYNITRPEGYRINLTFTHFSLEDLSCNHDYIEVHDGGSESSTPLGTFCGDIIPDPVITTQHMMWIKFKTDQSIQKTGFQATYTSTIIKASSTTLSASQPTSSSIEYSATNTTTVLRTSTKEIHVTTPMNSATTTLTNDETSITTTKETTTTIYDETSNTMGTTTQAKQSTDGVESRITTLRDITVTPFPLETVRAQESAEELAEEMKATKEKLTVNKKKTSTYIRTKICAEDNRVTSVTIGSGGIAFLALVFIVLLVIDLPNLKNMFITFYQNLCHSEMAHAYRTCKAKMMRRCQ